MYRLIVGIMLLVNLNFPCLTQANTGPKVVFPEQEYNFGKIAEGEQATHIFRVLNGGDEPLEIIKVEPDCGCTAASLSKDKILPKEEGEIKVVFNSSGRPGEFQKNINVTTNDPQNKKTPLVIRGTVTKGPSPSLSVHNRKIEFGVINLKAPHPYALSVQNNGDQNLIISAIKNSRGEPLFGKETVVAPQERKIIPLTYQPQEVGIVNESITLYSNDPQRPRYYVFLSGYVEKDEKIIIRRQNKQSFIVSNNTQETITVIPPKSAGAAQAIEPYKNCQIDLGQTGELSISLGVKEKK